MKGILLFCSHVAYLTVTNISKYLRTHLAKVDQNAVSGK